MAMPVAVSILLILISVLLVRGPQNELASTVDTSLAHPRLLFSQSDLPEIKKRATLPIFQPTVKRLLERAEWQRRLR